MLKTTIALLFIFFSPMTQAAGDRGEIQRYTLLHDRLTIDRDLKKDKYSSFLDLDLYISSGIKSLINDVSTGTEDGISQVQKTLNMLEILSKYVNTEKLVDIDLVVGFPLPDIKHKNHYFYPSFFYHINFGLSLSVSNLGNATNPKASTYVRKDTKTGIYTIYKNRNKKSNVWKYALYQLLRGDLGEEISSSTLATTGKVFDLNQLTNEEKILATDITFVKDKETYQYIAEVKELKVLSMGGPESLYGSSPLLHFRYGKKIKTDRTSWLLFAGEHYRKWYTLVEGLYLGATMKLKSEVPFEVTTKISNEFISLMPQFKTSWFRFTYSFKNPWRNPQNKFWVASTHGINLSFPFP